MDSSIDWFAFQMSIGILCCCVWNGWFRENDSADSQVCGSLLKEAGKKRDKGRQSEKNVKSVKSYDKNVSLFLTLGINDRSFTQCGWWWGGVVCSYQLKVV